MGGGGGLPCENVEFLDTCMSLYNDVLVPF